MTDEEKFQFDLQGYLIIKNVLTLGEIAELNAIADEKSLKRSQSPETWSADIFRWGRPYEALIDHPKALPVLVELIGSRFRLDHDYGLFMNKGDDRGSLHGGQWKMPDWWFQCDQGTIRNGLCVLTYCLTPQFEGDGGFVCIPGSHKSNFLESIPEDVRDLRRTAPYVYQPILEAGDAVFFTEALVHGTMPWAGEHERRALIYKFNPGHCISSDRTYNPTDFPFLTDRQRRILAPPSLYNRAEVVNS